MKTFALLFLLQIIIFPQFATQNDSLFFLIEKADPRTLPEVEEKLIEFIYTADYKLGKALSDRLLQTAQHLKNKSLYIKVLIHSYRFYPFEKKIRLLNRAEFIADSGKYNELLAASFQFKSIAFRDNSMTDSAMIYCLKAKDLYIKIGQSDNLIGVLELIANMHYYAGQYDEAEKIYKNILESDPNLKQGWRYVTTMNNLGLIRMQQKKYTEAERYFLTSLEHVRSKKMKFSDSSGLAYLYRKLLEVSVAQHKIDSAEKYFSLGLFFSNRFGQHTELPGIYAAKGFVLYERMEYDSAIHYFNKAAELNTTYYDLRNELNIYDGLSKTFAAKKDLKNAYENLKLFLQTDEKSDSIFFRARYMNIYAEYNYKNYLREIEIHKTKNLLLQIIISIVVVSLSVISFYYIKLRNSHKLLVKKNITIASKQEIFSPFQKPDIISRPKEKNKKEDIEFDIEKYKGIIQRIEALSLQEKFYLNPMITISEVALKINTNRSYLSKAVNSIFNVSFSSYINELRIKEAVRIIAAGEHSNLNIDGIALKAGFNNRISFTQAFQKYTGVTPSFFMKNLDS